MQPPKAQPPKPDGKYSNRSETFLLEVIRGRSGLPAAALRFLLLCLAPIYCAGLGLYLLPYSTGIRKRRRLPCPVICIGNLTTGGTGKTPMTQLVCRLLFRRGLQPVVLSRGYGGEHEFGCAVVSDADHVYLTAAQAGDEAYLLAQTLPGVPVVVGKDRRVTGALAIQKFHPDVVVLDDGMQFWQLHRELDIVLLNASHPFDNGFTFPRGLLREPKSHLKRAGIVIITGAEAAQPVEIEAAVNEARKLAPNVPVLTGGLVATGISGVADKVEYNTDWLCGKQVASVCAIGNPASFERTLRDLGAQVETRIRFRDHQAVAESDLVRVQQQAAWAGAQALIITQKDAGRMRFPASNLPVLALQVSMAIDGGELELENLIAAHIDTIRQEHHA